MPLFERLADADFAYLTTIGRKTGRSHRIEIWFGVRGNSVYLLAGDGDSADWVKNIRKNGRIRIQIGSRAVSARARLVKRAGEDRSARELLDGKYMDWKPGRKLSSWARGAMTVAIDLPT